MMSILEKNLKTYSTVLTPSEQDKTCYELATLLKKKFNTVRLKLTTKFLKINKDEEIIINKYFEENFPEVEVDIVM